MQIHHLNPHTPALLRPHALTIGNYDGVHLGHQAMLSALVSDAKRMGLASAVMIFEPQPREFFSPDDPPARLSSLAEKSRMIADLGVDYLLVARFDDDFRKLSASDFVQILKQMNTEHLVLGDDFRFGHDRMGNAQFLQASGFSVDCLSSVLSADQRVSSTLIRQALQDNDLAMASRLLGRDYAITGQVVHGDKIGRTLDFPTANVALNRLRPALTGVFGADVWAFDGDTPLSWDSLCTDGQNGLRGLACGSLFGAVNIGIRPTLDKSEYRLEVHFPQLQADLYGLTLKVAFTHHLHAERKYDGLDSLKQGIQDDITALLAWRTMKLG